MRYLLIILIFILSFTIVNGQTRPSGFPSQSNLGWQKWGWSQSDSGLIPPKRDTNFLPRFSGTMVFRPGDRRYYYYDSTDLRWYSLTQSAGDSSFVYVDYIPQASAPSYSEGRLWYDNGNNTLSFYDQISGTSLQIGQENVVYARNNTGSQINNGQVVYVTGAIGQNPTVALARSNNINTTRTIGMATHDISNNSTGKITTFGLVNDINTSSFSAGDRLYLSSSTAGALTNVVPDTPNYVLFVGFCLTSHVNQGKILVDPQKTASRIYQITDTSFVVNEDTIKIHAPSSPSSGVTSVALSMPSAFNVSGSPITTNGTFAVTGAGTSAQYIRGNGTLATLDTTAIPSFSVKVRSLFSGTSPIIYNQSSGTFSLADLVTAGACTNCNVTFNSKGQAILYSSGSGGGASSDTAINIGSGIGLYKEKTTDTFNFKSLTEGYGINFTSNTNDINAEVDTSVIATQYDLTQIAPNAGYGIDINLDTIKVDTTTLDDRYKKRFNVKLYGAVGDGKRIYDGAMSSGSATFTSASAVFTSADIGKAIRVPYAGAGGIDLITTIAGFTNSTTVTLANSASSTVSNDTCVYGTDNTIAIRRTYDTAFAKGGGTVYVPNGVYILAGPLITNYGGVNPNCQIPLPIARYMGSGPNAGLNRTAIMLEGETMPNFSPNGLNADTLPSLKGAILYSIIDGSGNAPSVFASKALPGATSDSMNFSYYGFKNITIIVSPNKHFGGASIGGINLYWGCPLPCENLQITVDASAIGSPRPSNNVAGIILGKIVGETMSVLNNCHVSLFKYGICAGEHANLNQCEVYMCDKGLVTLHNVSAGIVNRCNVTWCIEPIFTPSSNIMGLIQSGGLSYFVFNELFSEVYAGNALGWWNYDNIITDSSNNLIGRATYLIARGGVGIDNSLFTHVGAEPPNFNAEAINKPAFYTSGNNLSNSNNGNITITTPGTVTLDATTTVNNHNFYVSNSSAGIGTNNISFPLTRTGLVVRAQTVDGAEVIVQPTSAGSGSTNGTAIVVSGNNASFYNRLNGSMNIGTNNSTSAIVIDNTNEVGINNASPSAQLHVTGSTRFDLGSDATGDLFTRSSGGNLQRIAAGTVGYVLTSNGSGTAPTWQASGSGRWMPTAVTGTNVTSATPDSATYMRQGNIISFSVPVVVNTSTAGACDFYFTLPIASSLSASYDVSGVAGGTPGSTGYATADTTNDRAQVVFTTTATGSQTITITGHYKITPP